MRHECCTCTISYTHTEGTCQTLHASRFSLALRLGFVFLYFPFFVFNGKKTEARSVRSGNMEMARSASIACGEGGERDGAGEAVGSSEGAIRTDSAKQRPASANKAINA